jgi:hypothetical protein
MERLEVAAVAELDRLRSILSVQEQRIAAPRTALEPLSGQCKQVNGNCHGGSEFAPPHCDEFSPGQQNKLGCA